MDKKQLWAFYTPTHTVDYILSRVNNVTKFDKDSKILEPSWWDWAFVSSLLWSYDVNPKNIDVWDINIEVKEHILNYWVNFFCKDSLLESDILSESLFTTDEWIYTHVVWNPPYLNKQSDYMKSNKHKLKKVYSSIGVYDTYAMFIYLGSRLLKKWWCLGFIVSDTFLTLWIHKNFRKYILENFCVKEITLCQKSLFEWATVSTCIIIIENNKPTDDSKFIINNCRCTPIWQYDWIINKCSQRDTLGNPDHVFDINNNPSLLKMANSTDKMVDYLEWWLWMHTKDNNKYLSVVDYDGVNYAKKKTILNIVSSKEIDGKNWMFYHKQWWWFKYYLPAEYAVKRDDESVSNYVIPKNALWLKDKQWFIISWVCSSLSARLSTPWAMWESNKAMCFFPQVVDYPCEYFIWLLNSSHYANLMRTFNHTNSIQIRDIYKLPMIHLNEEDKDELIKYVKLIIESMKTNLEFDYSEYQEKIDRIVEKYFK